VRATGARSVRELRAFIDDVRTALLENPEEAALIQRNVKKLRAYFATDQRKAACRFLS
jgi:hypothetical protein